MKSQKPTTTTDTRPNVWELDSYEAEIALCGAVRYIDLHAMYRSNAGDSVIMGLIRGCYTDTKAFSAMDHQAIIGKNKATAQNHREQADTARKYLKRLTIDEEDRAKAEKALDSHTMAADNLMDEVADIERVDRAQTVTLAEDMLHTIWLELQAIKADPNRQNEKAFGELCRAGREYVTSMTAVSCIDSLSTIKRPLTRAEAVALMARYDVNPGARPRQKWHQTAKGCTGYYTLEADYLKRDTDPKKVSPYKVAQYMRYNDAVIWYYENVTLTATHSTHTTAWNALNAKAVAVRYWHRMTTAQKAVSLGLDPADNSLLYLVCHVPTIRTHYNTADMGDHDPRTAEAVADATLQAVNIPAIANRANLTRTERKAVAHLADAEAVQLARTAYRDALAKGETSMEKLQADRAKEGKKPHPPATMRQLAKKHQNHANNVYTATLWAYALTNAGFDEDGHKMAKSRIVKKLSKAYRNAPDTMTPGRADYVRMMQSISRGHSTGDQMPVDCLAWTSTTTANHKPVIRWSDSGQPVQSLTPGHDYRAEEILSRDSYRQTAPKATAPAMTERERARWEKLCKSVDEIGELWRAFSNGEPVPDYLTKRAEAPKPEHKPDPGHIYHMAEKGKFYYMAQPTPAPVFDLRPFVYGPPRPVKDAEQSAMVFLLHPPKATADQMARVVIDAHVMTKYGPGTIKEIDGDIITIKTGKSKKDKHRYNAPIAIASGAVTII